MELTTEQLGSVTSENQMKRANSQEWEKGISIAEGYSNAAASDTPEFIFCS
jgi:hypothetical protein